MCERHPCLFSIPHPLLHEQESQARKLKLPAAPEKSKEARMRKLSGWQRIGIVLSVMWLLAAAVIVLQEKADHSQQRLLQRIEGHCSERPVWLRGVFCRQMRAESGGRQHATKQIQRGRIFFATRVPSRIKPPARSNRSPLEH